MLRDLRIERVIVRRDDQGRWSYRLEGDLSKLVGIGGREFAVTDEPFATWTDEPGELVSPGLLALVPPAGMEGSR